MVTGLRSLLADHLQCLYSAESQLLNALPSLGRRASSLSLRAAFETYQDQTRTQVDRLAKAAELLAITPLGQVSVATASLLQEGQGLLYRESCDLTTDAALIAIVRRIAYYQISVYTSARALAVRLGDVEVAVLLGATLSEERANDETLSDICESEIFPAAALSSDEDAEPSDRVIGTR